MTNNQPPLPDGGEDIIQQVEAYTMAGISRAVLRGCIDRGELRVADRLGSRGSVRLYRSDVVRLMVERKWPGAANARAVPAQRDDGGCGDCPLRARLHDADARLHEAELRHQEELRREADRFQRLRHAFDVVVGQR
ncbi:hypothetical protein [Streptomyces sp. F-1]|uniref:hypothetical protein n=1 Tax=Streptomyces sp. F-1 TaxID=463642 RepID=UPI00085CCC59|nr:hypothetical protein [Streptomyces sp. F-1]